MNVTCALSELPLGHLDRMCLGFLQRQQMEPAGGSLGPGADILGAVGKPDLDIGSLQASPAAFLRMFCSLCPDQRHHAQEIERSLLSGFFRLRFGNLAVMTERTVSGALTDSTVSE